MATTWNIPRLSRRRFIAGGAAVGGAVALAGCGDYQASIKAHRVSRVPLDQPGSKLWDGAEETLVLLDGQLIAIPTKPAPMDFAVKVRALHDGEMVGFHLHWADDDVSDETVGLDRFRDACAVLIGAGNADPGIRPMGLVDNPVTLLHWKADWQRDIERGRQSITDVFPNVAVDTYPPLGKTAEVVTPQTYIDAHATQWLPAMHVGNPMATPTRTSPVEKLLANGYGTSTSAPTQNATGKGERSKSAWNVVLGRPLRAADEGEVDLVLGTPYTVAFALWSGAAGDRGSIKSPSRDAWLLELRD